MAEQTIDRLIVEVESSANEASTAGIDRIAASIERLRAAFGYGDVNTKVEGVAGSIAKLRDAMNGIGPSGTGFSKIMESINKLKEMQMDGVAGQIKELVSAMKGFEGLDKASVPMYQFGRGVNDMMNGLNKLQNADIYQIARDVEELTIAIKPLIQEMARSGTAMSTFAANMKGYSDAVKSANNMQIQFAKQTRRSRTGTGGGLGGLFKGLKLSNTVYLMKNLASAVKSVTQKLGGYVEKTNDYIENMNLFTVSMGEFTEKANEFTTRIQNDLGFDSGEAARYMGIFQQLSTSFGIAGDRAYILSKNLTQLGYDFASFYNLKTEDAFQKLQAAISGELEPIRRLGIDISAARLQQELYTLGINATVDSLTQADKETLRYIAIMKQVGNVTTDAARTITSPANALRVLRAQMDVTARQIGSVFIPMLNKIIPYLTAIVKIIGMLAAKLAAFLGFEMPTVDVPEPSGLPAVSEGLDDVAESAQEAKKQMAYLIGGFDELNRLEAKQEAGKDALGIGNLLDNIDLPEYDMFEGLVTGNVDEIVQRIIDAFKRLRDTLMDLGLREVLQNFKDFWDQLSEQIKQYDFATAVKEALLNGFELAMSLINLAQRIVFPIVIALDVPGIVYETIQTVSALFAGLNDVIRALTPGAEEFVQRGLVPIAEWLGDKIRDGLQFLQEQFLKIGDWFREHTEMFTIFGETLGDLVGIIWSLIEPIADPIWEGFKTILGKLVDLALAMVENFVAMVQPLLDSAVAIYKWLDSIGAIDAIIEFLQQQIDGFIRVVGGIIDAFKGVIDFMTGVFSGDWSKIWTGIEEVFKGAVEAIKGILTMFLGDMVTDTQNWFENDIKPWFTLERWRELGENIVNGLIEGLENLWESIKQKFGGFIDFIKNILGIEGSAEAKKSGESTMQAYNNGINSGLPETTRIINSGTDTIKSSFSTSWNDILSTTDNAFNNINRKSEESLSGLNSTAESQLSAFNSEWERSWEKSGNTVTTSFGYMNQTVGSSFNKMQDSRMHFQSTFTSGWSGGMNSINTTTSRTFSSMRSSASSAFSSIQSMASSMISRVRDAISALKDLISQQDKVKAGGSYAANLKNNPNRVQINNMRPRAVPALANGGVIRKPTYALVGEYSGANTNPEIVAPKSTIQESVVEANGSMVDAMYQMAQMMIAAIREGKDISIQIDGREVGKASAAYMRDEERRTGKNPGKL